MDREMEIQEGETNDERLRSQIAVRCAKAALLLLSLKSTPSHDPGVDKERERLLKVIADMRLELVKERYNNKQIKLCAAVEVALQITVVLSVASFFCLFLASSRFI